MCLLLPICVLRPSLTSSQHVSNVIMSCLGTGCVTIYWDFWFHQGLFSVSLKEIFLSQFLAKWFTKAQLGPMKTAPLLYKDYWNEGTHMGQNSKQINIAKYVSKFLIYGAKMLDKCVKSQKKFFVHCPFLQSQAK